MFNTRGLIKRSSGNDEAGSMEQIETGLFVFGSYSVKSLDFPHHSSL